ncbi:MAG TPA: hypothetical protein VKT83_08190 [bacterium]|nr:hypothetical protein [bacterium]
MRLPRFFAATLLIAALAVPLEQGEAANPTMAVSPAATSFAEDVNSPGSGWTFGTGAAWFPAVWSDNAAYTYTSCVRVSAANANGNSSWSAEYTTSPSTSLHVGLAVAGTASCGTPAAAGTDIGNSSFTTLNQTGNATAYYYVVVQPTVAVSSTVTISLTFKVQSTAATLAITMSPGNAIAVTITPSSAGLLEDVTLSAGNNSGWAFAAGKPWIPGTTWNDNSAYTYGTGAAGCFTVSVRTSVQNWNLSAFYTTSPTPSKPINVALAQAGTGSTCNAPAAAGTVIGSSPATVLANQGGTQTVDYYVVVQPALAVTSNVAVTMTFTAQ